MLALLAALAVALAAAPLPDRFQPDTFACEPGVTAAQWLSRLDTAAVLPAGSEQRRQGVAQAFACGFAAARAGGPRAAAWPVLERARDAFLDDDDPDLAEFFERYRPLPPAAAAAARAEAERLRDKALSLYPSHRRQLDAAWDEARRRAGPSEASAYDAWGVLYPLELRWLVGHPDASAELGVLPKPWRAGWDRPAPAPASGPALLSGIGVTFGSEDGFIKVLGVLPGGPAGRDGRLAKGDRVLALGQEGGAFVDVRGLALERFTPMVRGSKGTQVRLRVLTAGGARRDIALTRDRITLTEPGCERPPLKPRPPAAPAPLGRAAGLVLGLSLAAALALGVRLAVRLKDPAAGSVAAGVAFCVAAAALLGALQPLNNRWTDLLQRGRGWSAADSRVSVVAIDDESFKRYPDGAELELLNGDRLFGYGPRVVGYDILYVDEMPFEQARVVAAAACRWGARLAFAMMARPRRGGMAMREPFEPLAAVMRSLGVSTQLPDSDGVLRRAPLFFATGPDERAWPADPWRRPSLALRLASVYTGRPEESFLAGGNIRRFDPSPAVRVISAARVLDGTLSEGDRRALEGGLVVVGYTASGKGDLAATPMDTRLPSAVVVAQLASDLLQGRFLRDMPPWAAALLIALFALLAAQLMRLPTTAGVAGAAALAGVWAGATVLLLRSGVVAPLAGPVLAAWGSFGALLVRRTRYDEKARKRIKQTFGQFVAPEVVKELARTGANVEVGGETRVMTVFFLDIASFTTLSEKLGPKDLIVALNKCLSAFSRRIHARHGVIDKYIGDSVMAFWNAPLEQPDHALQACLAALDCAEEARRLDKELASLLPFPLRVRFGAATGPMTVGLTGSEVKVQYTVIGDEVNLASRLEGANKFFHSTILVSEPCFLAARAGVEGRFVGRVRVTGKDTAVGVYEVLARKGELPQPWRSALPLYEEALACFDRREYARAAELMGQVLEQAPEDRPSSLYLDKARALQADPGQPWDGVFNLRSK